MIECAMGQANKRNLIIATVKPRSPAHRAGLKPFSSIIRVNGHSVEDEIDFHYWSSEPYLVIEILFQGRYRRCTVERNPGEFLGISFTQSSIKQCGNRCLFCFIDQLPPGMRRSLYIKDEDYRYSFLHGNYITLTSLTSSIRDKIIRFALSPLYISVHATDPAVRCILLGNRRAGSIMTQLSQLISGGIGLHTQIVVCPGINDGVILAKTLSDLTGLGPNVLSIAVVPVGLTKHRSSHLQPISTAHARDICRMVQHFSTQDRNLTGIRRVFCADEFFIRAQKTIPPVSYYAGYPQIENGVGLIRQLLEEWKECKKELDQHARESTTCGHRGKGEEKSTGTTVVNTTASAPEPASAKRYLVLTSQSAFPSICTVFGDLQHYLHRSIFDLAAVKNNFFGESVTVAGLLCGRDIIAVAKGFFPPWDCLIVPAVIFNHNGVTLDGYSLLRIRKQLGGRPIFVAKDLHQLITYVQRYIPRRKRK
ncbi:MAG: DUF512 domain-containing protein [Chitinivibrionales bacterium]|nr:DUF512 domain-containing protein [Chitinivibrionales bacterium]